MLRASLNRSRVAGMYIKRWKYVNDSKHSRTPATLRQPMRWPNPRCRYNTMPLSLSSGLARFLRAIFLGVVVVGPPDRLIGPDPGFLTCVNQILDNESVDAASYLPSTLEALCASPQSLGRLSKLRFTGFCGGTSHVSNENVATRLRSLSTKI